MAERLSDEYVAKALQDARRFSGCWDAGTSGTLAAHTYRLIREREELLSEIKSLEDQTAALRAAAEANEPDAIPAVFFESNRYVTMRAAEPVPDVELKPVMVGSSLPPEAAKSAWDAIKNRHQQALAAARGDAPLEAAPPLELPTAPCQVIGITGRAGAGKNLVASMIPEATIIGLADPIYEMLAVMLGVDQDELRDRGRKEAPIPWLGRSPRELLQTLGTEWGRSLVRPDVWVTLCGRRIDQELADGAAVVVVADVRFDNEAEMIRNRGGQVWAVSRPELGEKLGHSSERGLSPQLVDLTIENAGTVEQLRSRVYAALSR